MTNAANGSTTWRRPACASSSRRSPITRSGGSCSGSGRRPASGASTRSRPPGTSEGATPLQWQWRNRVRPRRDSCTSPSIDIMHLRHSKIWSTSFNKCFRYCREALETLPPGRPMGRGTVKVVPGRQSIRLWSRTNLRPATSHATLVAVVVDARLCRPHHGRDAAGGRAVGGGAAVGPPNGPARGPRRRLHPGGAGAAGGRAGGCGDRGHQGLAREPRHFSGSGGIA